MKKIKISDITIERIKDQKLRKYIPEFYKLKRVIENNSWHNRETVFNHTLAVLGELNKTVKKLNPKIKKYLNQKVESYTRKDLLFLSAIFHDIAKKKTLVKANDKTSCPNHEKLASKEVLKILDRFDLSKSEKKIVVEIIINHGLIHYMLYPGNKKFDLDYKKFKSKNSKIYPELIILATADTARSYLRKTSPVEFDFRMGFYKKFFNQYS